MKIFPKILLGLTGLVLALLVALAVAVTLLFDPQEYQPLLADSVEKATGRSFTLAGELGLDLFPCCSVTLERASLGNPPGFPEGEFASVASAALSVKIWPLLTRREVQIGTVRLDGLNANLQVRKDGVANWEFDSEAAASSATPGGEPAAAGDFAIEGIEIHAGRVAYSDATDQSAYLAEDLELVTGDIAAGRPFDLELATKLTDPSDGTAGSVTLAGQVSVDDALSRITLTGAEIGLKVAGGAVPAAGLTATLKPAELVLDFARETFAEFRQLEGEFALTGLESLAGDASGSVSADTARLEMGASSGLTIPQLAGAVTVSGADVPGGPVKTQFTLGGLALDLDKMWGAVESLNADVSGLGGRMTLTGGGRIADKGAALKGTLKIEPLSPRAVLALLEEPEPQTADPKALTHLSGSARWQLGEDTLRFEDMDIRLDDTHFTGMLGVSDFDQPLTRFDLNLDAMDLDRYLEPEVPAAAGKAAGEGEAGAAADDIPVDTLRDLRLDGRLKAAQLKYAGIAMSGVEVTLRAADGRLRLDPLRARLYGGEYRGAISVDASGPQARLTTEQQVSALQVGEALAALYQTDKLSGALTGRISASGSGNSSDALLRTLSGNVALDLADGVYLGTDLWHEIRSARARLKGEAPPPASPSPRTPLEALQFAGRLDNGTLHTEQLLAEIPFIRVSGAGALDLVGKALDYRVQAEVLENPSFEDGTTLKDLKGLAIPVTLKGPMDKPKVSVDLKNLATGVATKKLTDRLMKKLGLDETAPAGGEAPATPPPADPAQPAEPPQEEKPRDALKRQLRDIFKPQQ